MLTATYTLVALSVEQASVRVSLQSLQKLLQSNFHYQSALTQVQVKHTYHAVQRLYDTCRWRKIEMFLIPAIQRATHDADQLLPDLDCLSRAAATSMDALAEGLDNTLIDCEAKVANFCACVETFCGALLQRLEREEKELFPVARAVISGETWFSLANQMLAHDANRQERKPLPKVVDGPRMPCRAPRTEIEHLHDEPFSAVYAH
jgi:hemerythrin-like domain-containing protein